MACSLDAAGRRGRVAEIAALGRDLHAATTDGGRAVLRFRAGDAVRAGRRR